MILSRSPVRITLGGGGTDLPSYYSKYGGFLIAGAIDKYLIVGANKQFYNTYSLKYSKIEIVDNIDKIKHSLLREALRLTKTEKRIEITSLADVPAGTGLGSSGAFLTALLNTLYTFKGIEKTKRQLAEDACKIELEILKEHEGKQDKYACAFGGIRAYEFKKNGNVSVISLTNGDIITSELEDKLSIFFTGYTRSGTASDVLKKQDEKTKKNDEKVIEALHRIKEIGYETKKALEEGNIDNFGKMLNEHWNIKKSISSKPPNKFINDCYKYALKRGATGGKVMGASTDVGFFMLYHPGTAKEQWEFHSEMEKIGLYRMPFKFDKEGTITIFNGDEG